MATTKNFQRDLLSAPLKYDFACKRAIYKTDVPSPKQRRLRLGMIGFVSGLWVALLVYRLSSLQLFDFEKWQEWAFKQHSTEFQLSAERGRIVDRNGKLLAVSVPAGSVYVRPAQIKDKSKTAAELSKILDMDASSIMQKLQKKDSFVWLKRQIPRSDADRINDLGFKGVGSVLESRRYYPYAESASVLLGKVGIDGEGLSGLERVYNRYLKGQEITSQATKDAFGNMIAISKDDQNFEVPKGQGLELTIDSNLQMIVDQELEEGRINAKAKRAYAVMVDADSGEILALSQAPNFDLNTNEIANNDYLKNYVAESVYEPGSTFKPLIAAAAIDSGAVRPEEMIDCENGRMVFGKHTIKDVHAQKVISVSDIIIRSSNIGMAKIGAKLGAERLYQAISDFGFGQVSGASLPTESRGILRNEKDWATVDVATHSFGQGIAVTPLQMVRATSAIVNGGLLPKLKIVRDRNLDLPKRILSEKTAAKVREIMYDVVENESGTGKLSKIEGIRVGGKTGTAQKALANGRGYAQGLYVASFVGFADARLLGVDRKLTLIVAIDEPNAATIYGGTLAAPVFKRIMQRSLHHIATSNQLAPTRQMQDSGVMSIAYRP